MKVKPKKCKGTSKAINYDGCGKEVLYRKFGLCKVSCYRKWLMNTKEGQLELKKAAFKAKKPRLDLEKAFKEKKNRDKITDHLKNTKTIVHKMVRLRDEGKPCISCDAPWSKDFQAGHCYNANNYRSIKFEFLNINGQCKTCNLMLDGNVDGYLIRLDQRIGKDNFDKLQLLARKDKKFNKQWTKDELSGIRKQAKEIIKQLDN